MIRATTIKSISNDVMALGQCMVGMHAAMRGTHARMHAAAPRRRIAARPRSKELLATLARGAAGVCHELS